MVAEWSLTDHLARAVPQSSLAFSLARTLETPDGDFIDIDHIPACAASVPGVWPFCRTARRKQHTPVYAWHGRSAQPPRMGCGGPEFQGLLRRNEPHASALHGGETNDLHLVVQYCISLGYGSIVLVGFSMGRQSNAQVSRGSATGLSLHK